MQSTTAHILIRTFLAGLLFCTTLACVFYGVWQVIPPLPGGILAGPKLADCYLVGVLAAMTVGYYVLSKQLDTHRWYILCFGLVLSSELLLTAAFAFSHLPVVLVVGMASVFTALCFVTLGLLAVKPYPLVLRLLVAILLVVGFAFIVVG